MLRPRICKLYRLGSLPTPFKKWEGGGGGGGPLVWKRVMTVALPLRSCGCLKLTRLEKWGLSNN